MSLPPVWAEAALLFAACWLLAQVEIHVEGDKGWAESLPTWRFAPPWWLRLTNGKPLTGYHLYLTLFLLAMLHLPLLFAGPGLAMEGRILAIYFQMTVFWDFQWFAWNPAWGWARFRRERVWWFPRRLGGFPVEYYAGLGASAAVTALLWPEGLARWAAVSGLLAAASGLSAAVGARLLRAS